MIYCFGARSERLPMRISAWLFCLVFLIFPAPAPAQETRTFTDALGRSMVIPVKPRRIVAFRHDSLTTPLLELGAPVAGTGIQVNQVTGETFIRGATDILGINIGEESGIASIGAATEPDIEAVAALRPDLILLHSSHAELLDQLEKIAPAVVVPDSLLFLDHLAYLADVVGLSDTYDSKLASYRRKIEFIRKTLGDPARITVSRPQIFADRIGYYRNWGAVDQVIADIGFNLPGIVRNRTGGTIRYSVETLEEFDADLLLTGYADHFGQTVAALTEEWDRGIPYWRNLSAVKTGNHFWYPRDIWVGYTFRSLDVVADTLLMLTAGRFESDG